MQKLAILLILLIISCQEQSNLVPQDVDGLDCVGGYCNAKNIECNETSCVYDSELF